MSGILVGNRGPKRDQGCYSSLSGFFTMEFRNSFCTSFSGSPLFPEPYIPHV